ncbi:hypothetical protein A3860_20255 [Niastella vici]|uniref:Secretion system C-terminal sorting domain-containing protein n=1 Tax=Niastella vici TaxID=1703345 RepID=A0A1V9G1C1_9BACT|nr:T9SS type A sorting domain-containing protein [Niastella vici]OQP64308.1 hypothetical protein A3860_20255 [Niastella vici]
MKQIYRLYGIPRRIQSTTLLTALSFSLCLLLTATSQAQVNAYARVTAINTARTQLTIDNLNETYHTFAANERVIVLQMQDNVIGTNTSNNASFGNLSAISNAGFYYMGVISAINTGRTIITLTAAMPNTFTIGTNSNVQVVSLTTLSTGNYTTTANIPAVAWNGITGGVVAIEVGGTLTLKNNITADGQGFAGGNISTVNDSACAPGVYRINSTRYGAKGQGIYLSTSTWYNYARGHLLNGGGGGNFNNAGGAGGGNYSAGGDGGAGYTCSGTPSGGVGGIALNTYLLAGTRLFMGGGGGGGQGNNSTQTAGAAGGGIVIIKANAITTSCSSSNVRISANGATAANSGGDGAGGAGAGGTILFQVNSFTVPSTCPLQIQANGGDGGNVINTDTHGGGGGGGQGAVLFANAAPTTNVTTTTTPGTGGLNSSASGATHAGSGAGTANSGVISGIGIILPVHLIYFGADKYDQKALLRWTASGEDNTVFTVLHATDGINFTTIGTVKGNSNGNAATNYSFTDANPAPGINYYQLQITGDPGTRTTYSSIVSVNITDAQSVAVAYPNPAHDHFSIRVNNEYNNKAHQVTITDLTGKLMYTNNYKPANGIITVTPAHFLKPGLYIFKITSEGYEQTGKLMIR